MDIYFFKKLCFIVGILFLIPVFAKEDCKSSTSLHPEIHYGECFDTGEGSGSIFRLKIDFNNDGLIDEAYGFSRYFGNGGGPWTLFLQTSSGRYVILREDLSFHPYAIHIAPLKPGKSHVSTYHRNDSSSGTLLVQEISKEKILTISKKKIQGSSSEYKKLFGKLLDNPIVQSCQTKDFVKNSCNWKN